MHGPFDAVAEEYDRWYDSPEGASVFAAELACLRSVIPRTAGAWVEVGAGTGRFAQSLDIPLGIDVSSPMLLLARRRGVAVICGTGEQLPLRPGSFDGVLMVATLCFMRDPLRALRESARILRPDGRLVIGHIPADGPWGRYYRRKARAGHALYSHARFTTSVQLAHVAHHAGLVPLGAASTLFQPPGEAPAPAPCIRPGAVAGAGFVALVLGRTIAN